MPIRGHRKNRREGETKKCDRVGCKKGPQGGGHFEEQGGGRDGELSKKCQKTMILGGKHNFFTLQEKNLENPRKILHFFLSGRGQDQKFSQILLLGGLKMAIGRGTYYGESQPNGIPPRGPPPGPPRGGGEWGVFGSVQ